jgi:OOP family OmpA-OmpF porin
MKSKAFLVVVLFLMWSVVSGWYFICKIKQACPSSNSELPTTAHILYDKGSATPKLQPTFSDFKVKLLSQLSDSNAWALEIIGLYDEDEVSDSTTENLGVARAVGARELFREVPDGEVELSSRLLNFTADSNKLDAVRFRVLVRNDNVTETSFGAYIYYEGVIAKDTVPAKIEAYLTKLVKEERESLIEIVGYTDDTGGEQENFELGLERATALGDLLSELGFATERLIISSKGQNEPIADNSTEEGRAKNRRLMLIIKR